MSNVMNIASDYDDIASPEATWLNNTPSAELPSSAFAIEGNNVYQVLDAPIVLLCRRILTSQANWSI